MSTILTPDFISVAKDKAVGAYYPSPIPDFQHSEAASSFKSEFVSECRDAPTPLSALTYDAVNVLLKSVSITLENGLALERENIVKGISSIGQYTGVTGPIAFDRSGQRPTPLIYFYSIDSGYPGRLVASIPTKGP